MTEEQAARLRQYVARVGRAFRPARVGRTKDFANGLFREQLLLFQQRGHGGALGRELLLAKLACDQVDNVVHVLTVGRAPRGQGPFAMGSAAPTPLRARHKRDAQCSR